MSGGPAESTIAELVPLLEAGRVSPVEVVEGVVARLERYDGAFRSHITVCAERVLDEARSAEREIAAGRSLGPLHGVPLSHKDNLATAGVRTTAHSATLRDHVPERDAAAVARLAASGALLLGKTNLTEFACGDMHLFGDTPNPWDLRRYAGASSSGSASAVAARLVPGATGTDTGGSTRAPAALCGVVGVKPTYGRVSRSGLVPLSWSMDSVGPIARSVADAALLLAGMAEPLSGAPPLPAWDALPERLDGVRIGVPDTHVREGLEPAVAAAFEAALGVLRGLGGEVIDVSLPLLGRLAPIGNALVMHEGYGLHAPNLRARGGEYASKARRRIAAGALYGGADVARAAALRRVWSAQLNTAFGRVDALVMPTLPFTAFSREAWRDGAPDTSWATRGFNLSGTPALTLPCGFDADGLPIGLQVAAAAFDERAMFGVAHAYERATAWHLRAPPEPPPGAPELGPEPAPAPLPEPPAWVRERLALEGLELPEAEVRAAAAMMLATRDALRSLPDPPRDAFGMAGESLERFAPLRGGSDGT